MIAPHLEKLSKTHKNILFIIIDTEEMDELIASLEIMALPSFMIYKKGALVDKFAGSHVAILEQLIKKHFSNTSLWTQIVNIFDIL